MMQAEILMKTLESSGVKLSVNNGKLKVDAPTGELSAERLEIIRQHKSEIIRQLTQGRDEKLHIILNRMIANAVKFDVGPDNFQVIDQRNILSQAHIDFLNFRQAEILNHLQQSLLKKFIFNDCQTLFEDFAFQIKECEAIALESGVNETEAYNVAVHQATKEWFADSITEISS